MKKVRVLVVDDSAFARKVVRELLSADPRVEVIEIARDGLEALERIDQLKPDVVTLDLVMPNLDGLGVLRAMPATNAPRVVIVSISGAATELGIEALELGAFDVVEKPTALATDRLYEIGAELVEKVVAAARAPARTPRGPIASLPSPTVTAGVTQLIAIGASTGGPPAISRLLAALPADLPVPIAIVVHLPPEYTEAFARRLDNLSPLHVRHASEGLPLVAGEVVIARGGIHLAVARGADGEARCHLDLAPFERLHRPAVDVLFTSAAVAYGAGVLGVVLTGMGDDGCAGSRAIRAAGGRVLTESEASCVVYGMPRCVVEAGLSSASASIDAMAGAIVAAL
jgi:two-component system chemotaxis response regulator CheB